MKRPPGCDTSRSEPHARGTSPSPARDWEYQTHRFYLRLKAGDELGARRVVDRLTHAHCDVLAMCENLFTPVLSRIGAEWAAGSLSVAEEHRASAICARLLDRIEVRRSGPPRGVCIVATVQGEQHGLPAIMAAQVLKAEGWLVHHVGTSVPARDVAALAQAEHSDFVVLSATRPGAVEVTEVAARVIRWVTQRPVYVGGPGATLRQLLEQAAS